MVYAAAEPERDRERITENTRWLEQVQIKPGDAVLSPGSWTYTAPKRGRPGDNSNTQYALLGLQAASAAGVAVNPTVWALARDYWECAEKQGGGWAYTPDAQNITGSMTCAGISSLVIAGRQRQRGDEIIEGAAINNCGRKAVRCNLQAGLNWLADHADVNQNFGFGQQWKFYYLYGLERAGRLTGQQFLGSRDWFRLGAQELVQGQNRLTGSWRGALVESNELVATSFALIFLAKGRAPVLITKLRHAPGDDWNRDPDDVRNLVDVVSRDWETLLTWVIVDSKAAVTSAGELIRAPIVFFNGHQAPEFTTAEVEALRHYVEEGGFIFAEACCSRPEFDRAFKVEMKKMFPEQGSALKPLPPDHPVWTAEHQIDPSSHPLWGIEFNGSTRVIYSPRDLSCYWNQSEGMRENPAIQRAIKVGQNVIDYATGRKVPADKLTVR